MSAPTIGYAGLTHLGLNSAIASAARGFNVVGYDTDKAMVAALKQGRLPISEPQLLELLVSQNSRLLFDASPLSLSACDIVYISGDIPTDDQGNSDLVPVHAMLQSVTSSMRPDAVLVVLCQVPPGFTRLVRWPTSQLYYQVETLIFGRAVERALHPERIIVGCAHPLQSVDPRLLIFLRAFECPILPMRYESAELAKISINMFLVSSVSTANTLAELCEEVGADWAEIVPSLRLDKRIGAHAYINPGLGISGGNLERDLSTVLSYARTHSTDATVVAAWIAHSYHCKNWAWRKLQDLVLTQTPKAHLAVLGLTYKEETHSTKNSAGLALLEQLKGATVSVFDPVASFSSKGPEIYRAKTALEATISADALLIMTPWPEFRTISAESLLENMRGHIVIDPYRVLDGGKLRSEGFTYVTLGAPFDLDYDH